MIVPLNIRWSPLENEDALRDCRANVLVVDKAFAATGAELAKALPGLKLIYADDGDAPAGMENYEALLARSDADPRCDARSAPTSPASSTPAAPPAARKASCSATAI